MNDIHSIALESDEAGYVLTITDDGGGVKAWWLKDIDAQRQLLAVAREVQNYVDSHDEALAEWKDRSHPDATALYEKMMDGCA